MEFEDIDIPIDTYYAEGNSDDDDVSLTSYVYSTKLSRLELSVMDRGRTLASTTTQYRYENGRRYHAYRDGEYYQPNDEEMNHHEGIAHHLYLVTLDNELHLAPLENPKRILDIGTGIGTWAMDMAEKFPEAEILGTDLSPIQADIKPPNVHFEIDDCLSEWTYPPNHFDMIHMRTMMGSIPDWPALYRKCYEHLAPGGYIEQAECSINMQIHEGEISPGSVFETWTKAFYEAGDKWGKTMRTAELMADWIREAGFVDVVERRFKWPVGPWSSDPKLKELGRWNLLNWETGMEGWALALYTRQLKDLDLDLDFV
ncbi:MAG: hypothetical protein M1820_004365 [Bogoriella megaspora]|nr:MAG: hypothetical protein M1820_004365 [Bogoriella megaspora]